MRNSKSKSTHLYILSSGNKLKIGVTNDIESRVRTLQTGNPDEIIVEHIEERFKPWKAENYLHHQFSKYRTRGEWFEGLTVLKIRSMLMMYHDQE